MAIEYLGLSEINGPLVVLEGVKNASYEEIVEFHMDDGTQKIGRIVEIYEDKAVIQVFEGTDNMSLSNTHTRLTGHPMEIGLSEEILGRTFNGIGQPIDGLGEITPEVSLNINGLPLNPVKREYPRNYINTGISAIVDRNFRSFPETVSRMTSLPHRSYSRLLWVMTPMRTLQSCLLQWVLNTMSLNFSAVLSKRAAHLTT